MKVVRLEDTGAADEDEAELQNSPLGPEQLKRLGAAYEQTLLTLCVKDRNGPLTELIAKKIIEIGQTSLKDPAQISTRAIEELGLP